MICFVFFFFFQAEDGIRDSSVTGVQTCALPILLASGSYVYNSTKDKRERIGRLLQMHANKREEIAEVRAGDIAAAIGLKDTRTGDTLCDDENPIILEAMKFPNPVIDVAIEPRPTADQAKLG